MIYLIGDVVRVEGQGLDEFVLLSHESRHGTYATRSCGGYVGSVHRDDLRKVSHRPLTPEEQRQSVAVCAHWSRRACSTQ